MSVVALEPTGQQAPRAEAVEASVEHLVLFVNGATASSARAIRQVHALCEQHLQGHSSLTIVDVQREPEQLPERVLAIPTLLLVRPAEERMVVGDFSDATRVLTALNIASVRPGPESHDDG